MIPGACDLVQLLDLVRFVDRRRRWDAARDLRSPPIDPCALVPGPWSLVRDLQRLDLVQLRPGARAAAY